MDILWKFYFIKFILSYFTWFVHWIRRRRVKWWRTQRIIGKEKVKNSIKKDETFKKNCEYGNTNTQTKINISLNLTLKNERKWCSGGDVGSWWRSNNLNGKIFKNIKKR